MTLYEVWQHEYRACRYLEHLSIEDLHQRFYDIVANQLILTYENKIGLMPPEKEGQYWMKIFTHLLEELGLRDRPYPVGFEKQSIEQHHIPNPRHPLAEKAAKVISNIHKNRLEPGSYLIKYGKSAHLRRTLTHGEIRIAHASLYDDSSLNPAMRDKELKLYIQPPPSEMKINAYSGKTGLPKNTFNPIGNKVTFSTTTNYYVYCLAGILVPRLFVDFDADCCLVVQKPKEFIDRILNVFATVIKGWQQFVVPVTYIDPVISREHIDVITQKHFRYAYQKEFRILWLPRQLLVKDLNPLLLNIGSLQDICELVDLN